MIPFMKEDYLSKAIKHYSEKDRFLREDRKRSWLMGMRKKLWKRYNKGRSRSLFLGTEYKLKLALDAIFKQEMDKSEFVHIRKNHSLIKVFLMMYLYYVTESVSDQLNAILGSVKLRFGYVISIKKMFLDNIFGTEESLKELLISSGSIQNEGNLKKAQIITRGEGYLSVIQSHFKMSLPTKSYFVLAQLYEDCIQLTLHQVVQTVAKKKEAASIIIQDETIPIQNILDSLCEYLWKNDAFLTVCDDHKDDNFISQYFYTNESYKAFKIRMKNHLLKEVSTNTYLIG